MRSLLQKYTALLFVAGFLFISCDSQVQRSKFIFEEVTLEYIPEENVIAIFGKDFYEEGTDNLFTGKGSLLGNEGARNQWTFENGKLVKVEVFNKDNARLRENVYQNGKQIHSSSWYETGEKHIEWDKQAALTKEWHKNGELKSQIPWNEIGQVDGVVFTWDEEGNVLTEEEFKGGIKLEDSSLTAKQL